MLTPDELKTAKFFCLIGIGIFKKFLPDYVFFSCKRFYVKGNRITNCVRVYIVVSKFMDLKDFG